MSAARNLGVLLEQPWLQAEFETQQHQPMDGECPGLGFCRWEELSVPVSAQVGMYHHQGFPKRCFSHNKTKS